ncbi:MULTISPECIES: dephospho-CoA kinase [Halomonadaceae]|jgi:dephospho-CoA kinase|uniref:Dephospho-CoA kinase n=1 Tax=Vreelandella aquamarina TaxID=77097 RepID=A0A1N6E0C6_9GAMM|nr:MULTISPECIES: dephospho-CoA kinase [Halomonas]MED5252561.1 dephospho-CoA kinase [Pseudomonadota bacterium]MBV66516.1 dephospho-CoA kinase [Halomonas sp.]MCC4287603.1 dephospho-CoA kinase [Halomonas meridiana]MCC4290756.1 dephospho-CoA kinase [Halomonas axialensis]MCF2913347.1 dephospho-CoA kinase [Halomonas sp. Cn5-12]|tara:strand:+ start:209 stop:805 length:597 start_codon:yes stop_codon:yes gene_type:complete
MIVGLTGGIGSGKSTVARAFGSLGIGWVDADDVAREVVMPGEPALAAIREHFGNDVLHADGTLNRAALRSIVFDNPTERKWLESVTHPRVRERILVHLERLQRQSPYVLLVSPLLFESGQDKLVDRTVVVDVPVELQLSRTRARDDVSEAQVHAILAAQLPREERLTKANDVIDNSGDHASMMQQVTQLDQHYRNKYL